MRTKLIVACLLTLVLFSGCAAIKQAYEDKKLSDSTPLAAGEKDPYDRGFQTAQPLSSLPWGAGMAAVPVVGTILGWWFASRRGKRIRLAKQPESVNPITGHLGNSIGLEGIVQNAADAFTGVFDVGKDGSAAKRGWKMAVIGGLATVAIPAIDGLISHITQNPPAGLNPLIVAGIAALLGSAEKWLSNVLPVKTDKPAVIA